MAEKKTPPLERVIVSRIVKALKAYGVTWIVKTHGGPFQSAGIPDILCVAPNSGRLCAIEVKRPDGYGKVTELQNRQIAVLNATGAVAGIATCEGEALALLARANERSCLGC